MENARLEFEHSWATRAGLVLLTGCAGWATLVAWKMAPVGMELVLAMAPAAMLLFGMYRVYLTLRSVRLTTDAIEMRHPWGTRVARFDEVKGLRFDSYPHDLVVKTADREFRLPRTVEGFRKLHEVVIERTHHGEHETLPVEVRVRRSVRFVSLVAVTMQVLIGYYLMQLGLGLFAVVLGLSLLMATYVFLDQYCLRRCVFQADGLWVHGLLGKKFFPHGDLSETEVKKTNLWSRMKLHFGRQTVTLEDRVMDLPVVRLARIVEREWGHSVHGMRPHKEAA